MGCEGAGELLWGRSSAPRPTLTFVLLDPENFKGVVSGKATELQAATPTTYPAHGRLSYL